MVPRVNSLTILQTGMKYMFYFLTHLMTNKQRFLNGVAEYDAVLLKNRKVHLICSNLVSKCSACSK